MWSQAAIEGKPIEGVSMSAFHSFEAGDEKNLANMRDLFGPGQIDQLIRQAIQFCWMGLPKEKQNVDEMERQIRRIVDRALRDFRDDRVEFGHHPADDSN